MTTPTPEQSAFIDAVGYTKDSLRLDAVAGSGKTTTLLRAAQLIAPTQRAIALAFNKAIAEELTKRFPPHIQCKTLNGVGHGVWMKHAGRRVLNARKLGDIVSEWVEKNCEGEEGQIMWAQLRAIATMVRSEGYIPRQWSGRTAIPAPEFTYDVFESFCDRCEIVPSEVLANGVEQIILTSIGRAFSTDIDFDDQIYMSTYFAPADAWPNYDIVMVDEAQDLSRVQHDMVERLGAKSRLIVVGDAHQAIYGWRGASCRSLDELETRFGLRRMPLTVSFRCPEAVIREAQKLVPHIQHHKTGGEVSHWPAIKRIKGDDEPNTWEPGWFTDDFAEGTVILCRNNAPLIRIGFGLVVQGRKVFFANKDQGVGLKKVIEGLPAGAPLQAALTDWYEEARDKLAAKRKFAQLDILEDKYEALEAIIAGAKARTAAEVIRGIEKLFLREPSPDAIELSTIHKSKGKEWHTVYLLMPELIPGKWIKEMEANGVPGAEDLLQQESNLKYVAITRALHTLVYLGMDREIEIYSKKSWAERTDDEAQPEEEESF